jgi:hypothetical protein
MVRMLCAIVMLIAILVSGNSACGMADNSLESADLDGEGFGQIPQDSGIGNEYLSGDTKNTDLLFYETTGGSGSLYTADALGGLQLSNDYNWSAGWSHIIPGKFNGDGYTDLLFYNSTMGLSGFALTVDGALQQSLEMQTLSAGWTHIIPGNFNGDYYTDLLLYNSITGDAQFAYTVDGDIQGSSAMQTLDTGWTHIITGSFVQEDVGIVPGDELIQTPEGRRYEIIVETEEEYGPGDEYPGISVILDGTLRESGSLRLEDPANYLEITSKRVYVFYLADLGDIQGISIDFDRSRDRIPWNLIQVIVKSGGESWTFPYEDRLQGNGGLY